MKKSVVPEGMTASDMIDRRIEELGDWRGKMLGRLRVLVRKADPEVVEEWKWNVPVRRGARGLGAARRRSEGWG